MANIKGILFDKDGTLFDFNKTWTTWAYGFLLDLAAGDSEKASRLGDVIGFDMVARVFLPGSLAVSATPGVTAQALVPYLPGLSQGELELRMNTTTADAPQAAAAELVPLLSALRLAGLKLGVATNDAEAPALAHLVEAGIHDQFDFIAGYDSGFGAKPDAGMLLAFADATGIAPAQIMMVGDSRHDLLAGRAAGMMTVGVLTGVASAQELQPLAHHILPDISQLPGLLNLTVSNES